MPAMVVTITNITDAPESKQPMTQVAIYTTHLDPGEELKLPATMVDARLRKLEADGYIAINQVPPWYAASKAKRLGRQKLTHEELEKRLVKAKPSEEPKIEEGPKDESKPEEPKAFEDERFPHKRRKTYPLEELAKEDKSDKK